jgi:hypothetical protein
MSREEHHFKKMVSILQAEDQKEREKIDNKIKNRDKYRKGMYEIFKYFISF